jgi:hypothetical protein
MAALISGGVGSEQAVNVSEPIAKAQIKYAERRGIVMTEKFIVRMTNMRRNRY